MPTRLLAFILILLACFAGCSTAAKPPHREPSRKQQQTCEKCSAVWIVYSRYEARPTVAWCSFDADLCATGAAILDGPGPWSTKSDRFESHCRECIGCRAYWYPADGLIGDGWGNPFDDFPDEDIPDD